MMKMRTLIQLSLIAFVAFLGFPARSLIAGETVRLPDEFRTQLQANVAILSPIEVVWKRQRESTIGKSELMAKIKYKEFVKYEFFAEFSFIDRWQDRMMYEFLEQPVADRLPAHPTDPVKIIPLHVETAYDLDHVYIGDGERLRRAPGRYPHLQIDRGSDPKFAKPSIRVLFRSDYLREVGYWTPSICAELGRPASHIILHLLDSGATLTSVRRVFIDNIECVEVKLEEPKLIHLFLLEPDKAYALRRHTEIVKNSGQTARVVECRDYQNVKAPSLWLPKRCQIDYYTWETIFPTCSHEPIVNETLSLDSVATARMPTTMFVLKYSTPGTFVTDFTAPKAQRSYRVAAKAEDLKSGIDAAKKLIESPKRIWLLVLNLVAIAVLIGVFLWRRRRRFRR